MSLSSYDLFVIGGGVNGTGIARDAAGRGYSVYLAEMDDLASGTSSAATKLIHGGLRYLEYYDFRLVRESLIEREILWGIAPHLISPLRFILPHHKDLRPAWMLRAGLFLYDHLGGRKKLPPTKTINLRTHETGRPLRGNFKRGFEYSDCWVDDARLVVMTAKDAAERGATIRPRTKLVGARRSSEGWTLTVRDQKSGTEETVTAKMVINAAGPWIDDVLKAVEGKGNVHNVRLVKGSHIVVEKLYDHNEAYIFQNADGRIIFAIPYEGHFTLIGTTDLDYDGDPADVAISAEEITYLTEAASEYFAQGVSRDKVVWAYSGVRPLYDDGASKAQEATRDYVLKLDQPDPGTPALLNVFGGKLTTYRRLAETVLDRIDTVFGRKTKSWTAKTALPGGDFDVYGRDSVAARLEGLYPFLTPSDTRRLAGAYGTRAEKVLGDAAHLSDLGEMFGETLSQREVDYLIDQEWAQTVEDILWRRSKLGLFMGERDERALAAYVQTRTATTQPA